MKNEGEVNEEFFSKAHILAARGHQRSKEAIYKLKYVKHIFIQKQCPYPTMLDVKMHKQ